MRSGSKSHDPVVIDRFGHAAMIVYHNQIRYWMPVSNRVGMDGHASLCNLKIRIRVSRLDRFWDGRVGSYCSELKI